MDAPKKSKHEIEQKMHVDRAEVVQRLRTLADQLELGTVVVEDRAFEVPDEIVLELEADNDELEIELKWKPVATEQPSQAPIPA